MMELTVDRSTASHGWDEQFCGYKRVAAVPEADRLDALHSICRALTPAPRNAVVHELARLRMLTKARPEQEQDLRLMAAAYAEEMAGYPLDVVADACRKWARVEKWWPAWAELKDMMDYRMKRRRALLKALSE